MPDNAGMDREQTPEQMAGTAGGTEPTAPADVTGEPVAQADGEARRSWRDSVDREDCRAVKRGWATAREERLMSSLWSRLFPIDYDAIPVADYTPADVPDLTTGQSGGLSSLVAGVAGAMAGSGQAEEPDAWDDAGEAAWDAVPRSDTSNADTVLIGNDALSEMLSGGAAASDDEDDHAVDDELSSLYDEAMDAFSDIDERAQAAAAERLAADEDADAQGADEQRASLADEEGQPEGAASDEDIYDSDEWREIEREIAATSQAISTGRDRLDLLAGIFDDESDGTTATEEASPIVGAEPEALSNAEPEDAAAADDTHADGTSEDVAMPEPFVLTDADEPTPQDGDESVASDEVANEVTGNEPEAVDVVAELGQEDEDAAQAQERKPTLLSRILGLFARKPQEARNRAEAEEASPAPVSSPPEAPTASAQEDDGAIITPDASEAAQQLAIAREEPVGQSDDDFIEIGEDYRVGDYEVPVGGIAMPLDEDDEAISLAEGISLPQDSQQTMPMDAVPDTPTDWLGETQPIAAEPSVPDGVTQPIDASQMTMPMTPEIPETVEIGGYDATMAVTPMPRVSQQERHRPRAGRDRIEHLRIDASPDFMLPLPMTRDGHIDAVVQMKATDFLKPKTGAAGARSSHIRLSVRPSKARLETLSVLSAGTGYLPVESPVGTRLRERVSYGHDSGRAGGRAS